MTPIEASARELFEFIMEENETEYTISFEPLPPAKW